MNKLVLEPIYGSLILAVFLVVVTLSVILWVTPPTADPGRRKILIGLRLAAASVLLLAVLRPSLVRLDNRAAAAVLVIALDTSKSMTFSDGDGQTRLQTQRVAFETLAAGLEDMENISGSAVAGNLRELDDGLTVKVLGYDQTTRPLGPAAARWNDRTASEIAAGLQATGNATDLAQVLRSAIASAEGQPIAGTVLFGDGTQTAAIQSVAIQSAAIQSAGIESAKTQSAGIAGGSAAQIAGTLDSLGVPLWTVPTGQPAGQDDQRDVEVASLVDSDQWFSGNEVEIDFQVVTKGLAGIDVPVQLRLVSAQGQSSEIATRRVQSRGASDSVSMNVRVVAPDPGAYQLVVEVPPQPGESITSNNQQMAFIDVRQGGGRVLYIEGSLRQEYVFLRRSLRRFPDLDMVSRWIPSDTQASWPVELPGAMTPGKYDIYILGDLPAAALGQDQLRGLAAAVDRGAGLVMLGGENAFAAGGYAQTALADVLPVTLGSPATDAANRSDMTLSLSLAGSHPIVDLGGDRPGQIWSSLPDQLGGSPLGQPKVAPGIEVLLETKSETSPPEPMLVVGGYGQGRVAAVAFDSTYRWWREGRSDVHRRFWRQMILWLLSRQPDNDAEIRIELDSRRFATDASPGFQATLDGSNQSLAPIQLAAEIIDAEGTVTKPNKVSGTDSAQKPNKVSGTDSAQITGTMPKLDPGIYRLRVSARGAGADDAGVNNGATPEQKTTIKPAEITFQVIDQSLEMSRRSADPVFLQQLADQTKNQGGRSFQPSEMDQLLDTIAKRRKRAQLPVVEKNRLGDGPGTGWPMFLVFALSLSAEWFLRRKWQLA